VEVYIHLWVEWLLRKEVWMKMFAVLHVRCHVKCHPAGTIPAVETLRVPFVGLRAECLNANTLLNMQIAACQYKIGTQYHHDHLPLRRIMYTCETAAA
jgi:hypothetical protein